jgi:hypothetical protein
MRGLGAANAALGTNAPAAAARRGAMTRKSEMRATGHGRAARETIQIVQAQILSVGHLDEPLGNADRHAGVLLADLGPSRF